MQPNKYGYSCMYIPVVLSRGRFCPLEESGNIWKQFWLWHLMGRGQRCCKHPRVYRTAPTAKSYSIQNVNSAKHEKSQYMCVPGCLCMCLYIHVLISQFCLLTQHRSRCLVAISTPVACILVSNTIPHKVTRACWNNG